MTRGSESGTGLWDLAFGLAVAAAGLTILLIWCLASSPRDGLAFQKSLPALSPCDKSTTPQNKADRIFAKPANPERENGR
jgi:hypothetical protein